LCDPGRAVRRADLPRLSISGIVPRLQTPWRPADVLLLPCWSYPAQAFSSDARHRGHALAHPQPGFHASVYHDACDHVLPGAVLWLKRAGEIAAFTHDAVACGARIFAISMSVVDFCSRMMTQSHPSRDEAKSL